MSLSPLGLGGDGLDGAHEDVRDDVDSYEAVDKSGKVEENSELPGPGDLHKEREEDSFLRANILGLGARGSLRGETEVGGVVLPDHSTHFMWRDDNRAQLGESLTL